MPRSHAIPEEITDPVTGFTYPGQWIVDCNDESGLALVRVGLAVLTSSGTVLKRGYTTGTTAAACCKAAILSLTEITREVEVTTPSGIRVSIPVTASRGVASCRKYAGDYPDDVTSGILFIAKCTPAKEEISLYPGEGIGRFSRDTPRYRKGEPAISTPSLGSILNAIHEGLSMTGLSGIILNISVPDGEIIAGKTLNPHIGIKGGISVLGTTGLVEPWDDHLTESMIERVRNSERVVLTTGRTGLRYARLLFPDHEVVLAGSHLKVAIEEARGPVVLCGLPALILKFLDPDLPGSTGYATIEEFSTRPEFNERMLAAFRMGKEKYPGLRVVIVDRSGSLIGDSG